MLFVFIKQRMQQTPVQIIQLKNFVCTEADINFLMKQSLQKLAFFPYALAVDRWRWKVYSGDISFDHLNSAWWNER